MRQAGPRSANLGIKGPAGLDLRAGDQSAVRFLFARKLAFGSRDSYGDMAAHADSRRARAR